MRHLICPEYFTAGPETISIRVKEFAVEIVSFISLFSSLPPTSQRKRERKKAISWAV